MIFVIVIPWLVLLVYLIVRGHGMQDRQLEQAKEAQAAQAAYIKSVAGPSSGDVTSEIAKAKGLLDSGAITQAESTSSRQRCSLPDFRHSWPAGSSAHPTQPTSSSLASSTLTCAGDCAGRRAPAVLTTLALPDAPISAVGSPICDRAIAAQRLCRPRSRLQSWTATLTPRLRSEAGRSRTGTETAKAARQKPLDPDGRAHAVCGRSVQHSVVPASARR